MRHKEPLRGSGGVDGRNAPARPIARSPALLFAPTASRSDVDCYRLKENERSELHGGAHVGFLARLERTRRAGFHGAEGWTLAWTDKRSPSYVVIDGARVKMR